MQGFFGRFAWRNLSLQAKTGLLFLVQMVLITILALVAFSGLSAVRRELDTDLTAAIEMRSLAQDIRLGIEQVQRMEQRLVEQQFGWDSFANVEANLRRDHAALTSGLIDDSARLEELGFSILAPRDMVPISIEVRTISTDSRTSEDNFDQILLTVEQLTRQPDGALTQLEAQGSRLEQLTVQQGDADLITQMLLIRSLEQTLIETGSANDLRELNNAADIYLEIFQENIPLAQRQEEIPQVVEVYRERAAEVSRLITQLQTTYRASQVSVGFSRDAASRLGVLTEAQRQVQLILISRIQNNARLTLIIGLVLVLILGSGLTYLFARNISGRTRSLLAAARQLEVGNLNARADVAGSDEFSRLGATFNDMAEQLQDLVGGLERRVAERTRDLSITAEIGQAVITLRDPRELMDEIVELIRSRFGYYHAQVFLVDQVGEMANLIASTGTAGRELLARRHALPVGSESVIGQVTAANRPIVALDTGASGVVHRPNPLLPDTRSEMALPMRIGDRVIGALDVQSVAPNAFDEDLVAVFQIMADQLAIALDNARLQTQLTEAQSNLDLVERQMTAEAWDTYRKVRSQDSPLSFEYRGGAVVEAADGQQAISVADALASGRLVAVDSDGGEPRLAVPIRVRGEVIGAFGFGGETLRNLAEEDLLLVEAVVDRVGLALENMRLVEETVRRAEHEQILNEITAKIVGSTDVNDILQTTVRELGRVLRAPQTSVQLRRERE